MNSLTRQQTLESVRSWWSDSNPTGPNINLHALAKPLMKLMYHRQALDYIAEHRFTPLSRGDMEIYASYLGFRYVSSTTKIAILRELTWENDTDTVADILSSYLGFLLESRNTDVQGLTCDLLERLARRSPNRTAAWAASVCKQLVSLLRDGSENVRADAFFALRAIAKNPEGAQAIIGAHVLDDLAELVKSPNFNVRARTHELVGELASRKVAVPRVLWANLCELLVSSCGALDLITKSPAAMQAALDANLLDYVAEILESPTPYTRELMCSMLAAHDGMLAALVGGTHCKQLVSLLGSLSGDGYVVEALRWIAKSPEGAQAVVDAAGNMRDAWSTGIPQLYSDGHPARNAFDSWARRNAVSALAQISEYPEGVAAIAGTDILRHVATLMENRDRAMQFQTCIILRNLCRYQPRRQDES
ncbi:armadillo-type protein [Mycena vulgaris]|nr:armadillo-type protein [Mycena vulgaris]